MATQTEMIQPQKDIPGDVVQMRRLGASEAATQEDSSDSTTGNQEDLETSLAQENQDNREYPTGLKFWLIIVTMTALIVLGGLDTNIVATAVPR